VPTLSTFHAGAGVAAFTGRQGGFSVGRFASANVSTRVGDRLTAVLANRRMIMAELGLPDRPLVTVDQEHGATVVDVDATDVGSAEGGSCALPVRADGMVTRTAGVALMVGLADCVPVALLDGVHPVVGILHAGWRGIAAGVVEAGVAAMRAAGADPSTTMAAIGPSVAACCYPVGDDVAGQVTGRFPAARARSTDGRPALDLRAAVDQALRRRGVVHVVGHRDCTAHQPGRYFSARRDGATGCQAGVVALRPAG
jgi:polyphenol oxidase